MILPLPRHFWHGPVDWAMPKGVRWVVRTVPLPRQSGQVSAVVPGAQPVPLQSGQVSMRGAVTSFSQPKAASSKLMFSEARTSSPRRGALGLRVWAPPPKMLEKMSPKPPPPKISSKPPKPPKPPAP